MLPPPLRTPPPAASRHWLITTAFIAAAVTPPASADAEGSSEAITAAADFLQAIRLRHAFTVVLASRFSRHYSH